MNPAPHYRNTSGKKTDDSHSAFHFRLPKPRVHDKEKSIKKINEPIEEKDKSLPGGAGKFPPGILCRVRQQLQPINSNTEYISAGLFIKAQRRGIKDRKKKRNDFCDAKKDWIYFSFQE